MKFATLRDQTLVALKSESAVPLSKAGYTGDMKSFIIDVSRRPELLNEIKIKISGIKEGFKFTPESFSAPLNNPNKIVAIGLNYAEHASESEMKIPEHPLAFAKFPSSITGPADKVEIPVKITQQGDYEVELGVIIGREAKNVNASDALNYVFGYTILNDISARDVQFSESQWVRSKSLDTFCPLGPVIVTRDEITDPQNLEIGCELNGVAMQQDNTKNMVVGVADLIAKLSRSFKFEPGDIIATGTPSGVGFKRNPPVYLREGDIIRSWIKGIGELVNIVSEV